MRLQQLINDGHLKGFIVSDREGRSTIGFRDAPKSPTRNKLTGKNEEGHAGLEARSTIIHNFSSVVVGRGGGGGETDEEGQEAIETLDEDGRSFFDVMMMQKTNTSEVGLHFEIILSISNYAFYLFSK